jgi:hypothetical protein
MEGGEVREVYRRRLRGTIDSRPVDRSELLGLWMPAKLPKEREAADLSVASLGPEGQPSELPSL